MAQPTGLGHRHGFGSRCTRGGTGRAASALAAAEVVERPPGADRQQRQAHDDCARPHGVIIHWMSKLSIVKVRCEHDVNAYVLICSDTKEAVVIDPGEP